MFFIRHYICLAVIIAFGFYCCLLFKIMVCKNSVHDIDTLFLHKSLDEFL